MKYNSAEEMQIKIDEYFDDCDTREAVYTIEGLAYWLDMDRKGITNYSNREDFFLTIKKARNRVLARLHELAATGKYNPAMAIFNLKNNYGYVDKVEVAPEKEETNVKSISIEYH